MTEEFLEKAVDNLKKAERNLAENLMFYSASIIGEEGDKRIKTLDCDVKQSERCQSLERNSCKTKWYVWFITKIYFKRKNFRNSVTNF